MRKHTLMIVIILLCGGCAHQELKAPCTDQLVSFTEVPCSDRQPVNLIAFNMDWTLREQ